MKQLFHTLHSAFAFISSVRRCGTEQDRAAIIAREVGRCRLTL